MFGPSEVLPMVLPFTQFYPGFTQLPRVKLGKTVLRFYPPTLVLTVAGAMLAVCWQWQVLCELCADSDRCYVSCVLTVAGVMSAVCWQWLVLCELCADSGRCYVSCVLTVIIDDVWMLCLVNRQGLDITLLAEPSSDEDKDEPPMKRKKCNSERRRRKQAATPSAARDKETKADIKLPLVSASVSSHSADTASADSKSLSGARPRRRFRSLCFFHLLLYCC